MHTVENGNMKRRSQPIPPPTPEKKGRKKEERKKKRKRKRKRNNRKDSVASSRTYLSSLREYSENASQAA
jgi:hypothetical protein